MKKNNLMITATMTSLLTCGVLHAQSSSLFHSQSNEPQLNKPIRAQEQGPGGQRINTQQQGNARSMPYRPNGGTPPMAAQSRTNDSTLAPALRGGLTTVVRPEPYAYELHDLITIIVRESVESESDASLGTTKEVTIDGEISEFPRIQVSDLLNLQVRPSDLVGVEPKVKVEMENSFDGEGTAERKDTFTTRVTAEIIDIKPNGTLVIEARRFVQHDKEELDMRLTGVCRPEDITAQNTVLSTQLHDMTLIKTHKGEIRKASKKGILTKIFEAIFNI